MRIGRVIKKRELLFCLCSDLWSSVIHNLLDQSSCNILILNLLRNDHHLPDHPKLPVSKPNSHKLKKWVFLPILGPWKEPFFCRDSRYFQPKWALHGSFILLLGFYFLFLGIQDSFQRPPDSRLLSYSSGLCSQRDFVELEITRVNVY